METLLFLLLGFVLGFLLILLIKLGQGMVANCTQCGQKHWVSSKKFNPVCKKCGTPLKLEKINSHKAVKAGSKKKKK